MSWSWLPSVFSAIAAGFSAYAAYKSYCLAKKDQESRLHSELQHLLEITIRFPYLEDKEFIAKWPEFVYHRETMSNGEKIRFLRYDQFSDMLFNFLAKVFTFYKEDRKKIENFVDVKTWVRLHRNKWTRPLEPYENIDAYNKNFRRFIDSYLT